MSVSQEAEMGAGHGTQLLRSAEDWPAARLEEQAGQLVEAATSVLLAASHEGKLEAIRWLGDKLACHVPAHELEETLLAPFLGVVLDFIQETVRELPGAGTETRQGCLVLVSELLEYTERVVQHCAACPGLGLGEVASLPVLLPAILITTFTFLSGGQAGDKESLAYFFSRARALLTTFLACMQEIKIRIVLEDEQELLTGLCTQLLSLPALLTPLDFKLTRAVWKVYIELTERHQSWLSDFDFHRAPNQVVEDLSSQLSQLRVRAVTEEPAWLVKTAGKAVWLAQLLHQLLLTHKLGDTRAFLQLLLDTAVASPAVSSLPAAPRARLETELTSSAARHRLLSLVQPAITAALLGERDCKAPVQLLDMPGPALQVCSDLLYVTPRAPPSLLRLFLTLVSAATPRSRPAHSDLLAALLPWLLTSDPAQLEQAVRVMLLHLLSPHSSPAACLLVCDCWAGLGRHAPAPLLISWLQLLQAVLTGLPTAALPALAIRALMPRLANRLGPAQAIQWAEQEAWPGGAAGAWARLEAGGWKVGRRPNTARRIARLVASTPSPDCDTLARAAQVLGSSPSPVSTTALLRLLAAAPPTPDNASTFKQTLSKVGRGPGEGVAGAAAVAGEALLLPEDWWLVQRWKVEEGEGAECSEQVVTGELLAARLTARPSASPSTSPTSKRRRLAAEKENSAELARRVEAGLEVLEEGAGKLAGTADLLSLQDKQRIRTVHSALACLLQTGPS